MKILINRFNILVLLVAIYLFPYSVFGIGIWGLYIINVLLRASFSGSNLYSVTSFSFYIYFFLLAITISAFANQIQFADLALSIIFYGFPLAVIFLMKFFEKEDYQYLIKVNTWFVLIQVPFLVFQYITISRTTDDWFTSSMMQPQNTQIVAFVFFLNFALYVFLYRTYRKRLYLLTTIISLICAIATNTLLMTFLVFFTIAVIVILKFKFSTKILILALSPFVVIAMYEIAQIITITDISSAIQALQMVYEQPELVLENVGKLRGLHFSVENLFSDSHNFLFGTGPGSMSSRLILYKEELRKYTYSTTNIDVLGPLHEKFKGFVRGLFLRSNLHRPWSSMAAVILEGGAVTIVPFVLLLRSSFSVLKSHKETLFVFLLFVFCCFIYHVIDNMKMSAFFFMVFMFFKYEKANSIKLK